MTVATAKPTVRTSASKKPAAKTAKPAKVPIATVRKLEAALVEPDVAQQCAALYAELADLESARAMAAAATILAHTRKGTPVARAYLTTLATEGVAPVEAADAVVRHCATMERGRKAMRGAFVACWRRASDMAAVDEAYKNFSRGIVDDPDLLTAGFEAARRNGNHLAAADRIALLERARRLAPLIADLAAAAPVRARAMTDLAKLSAEDRRHVNVRMLDVPRIYDEALVVAAVLALADDARVPDMVLSAAVADMRYHGKDALVAVWKKRVADGDHALITRLLALFEWTGLWATEDDHLEPFIHALYPAGARPEVFGQIEGALASESATVRQAVLKAWLDEVEGQQVFTDQQIDKLVRSTVAIAEAGNKTSDQQAANTALGSMSHAGARNALMAAVRNSSTAKNKQLREHLYSGLSQIDHPSIVAFLIERMFVEREEYSGLMEAIAHKLDSDAHREIMTTLGRRAKDTDAAHAAAVYAEILVDKKRSPRLLVELARGVATWEPPTNDDGRRLRYVAEQAVVAALALHSTDDARSLLARAKALPEKPYSDYRVIDRDQKTPAPLADADTKKQLAALESGKLDQQIADARAAADAARAAGKPIAADDEHLGKLAGCTVSGRLLDDRERRVVWFFDEVGGLHVYDGYSIVPPPFQMTGAGGTGIPSSAMAAFIAGKTIVDERITHFDAKHTNARDVIRIGDRVLVFDGRGKDYWEQIGLVVYGLKFGSFVLARDAVARFAANPPVGMKRAPSWYIEGVGAVRRKYYAPLPGGAYNKEGEARLAVLGSAIDGRTDERVPPLDRTHADADAAIKAMQAWEGRLFAAGGRITKIWVDQKTTRREDTVLAAFLGARARTDEEGAPWHLRSLGEMAAAIDEAGLRELVPDLKVTSGPPASEDAIAAYQASITEPLPAPLVEVWREVGRAGFSCTRTTIRFLSPAEALRERDKLRGELAVWLTTKLKGKKLAAYLEVAADIDVLATKDGAPLILFDTKQRVADGRCFCTAGQTWWEKALGWEIATTINSELKRELEMRLGDIYRLRLGERVARATKRVRLVKGDKTWEAIVGGVQLMTRTLTPKSPGRPAVKEFADAATAADAFDAAVAAAKKKGFA
ncbi:MAG: hypothetical protein JWO36_2633 [Myxococcales bacterium]|nr:hypothetical protein [Myxococcales bacterium]